MPSKEWRKKNPEKQEALAKIARARRWARIKDDPVLKAKANARMREWYAVPENKAKALARHSKSWREKPEVRRRRSTQNLLTLYGITLEQKEQMFLAQDSKCAICKSETTKGTGWHVDHCHETKRVRSVLCSSCNLMIGHAKENSQTLLSAVEYLR
jgi:hypothetical protein